MISLILQLSSWFFVNKSDRLFQMEIVKKKLFKIFSFRGKYQRARLKSKILNSNLFDKYYYAQRYSYAQKYSIEERFNSIENFIDVGLKKGRDPNPLFSSYFYNQTYSDVRLSKINPFIHYITYGAKEGRMPNAFFDPKYYAQETGCKLEEALTHYLSQNFDQFPCNKYFDIEILKEVFGSDCKYLIEFLKEENVEKRQTYLNRWIQKRQLKLAKRSSEKFELSNITYEILKLGTPNPTGSCDIVIPVKDSLHWLANCLYMLFNNKEKSLIREIIIVDDGSDSTTLNYLQETINSGIAPNLSLIRNIGEHGYGSTCNCGFNYSKANYVLFLNSDCLISHNTLSALINTINAHPKIGMVSALSNNSSNLTIPIQSGLTYFDISEKLELLSNNNLKQNYYHACTIVGHCLLTSRKCFSELNGFDPLWGKGYGEESDLHFRALAKDYWAVVATNTYVYHYGGGTFSFETDIQRLQKLNYSMFMKLWSDEYELSTKILSIEDPRDRLTKLIKEDKLIFFYDIVFILPAILGGIGGIQVVIDLCNHALINGIKATAVIVGEVNEERIKSYKEMLLFRPLQFSNTDEFLNSNIRTKTVIGTLFTTARIGRKFAQQNIISSNNIDNVNYYNFVQGYEPFFSSGERYLEAVASYKLAKNNIAISEWLASKIKSHDCSNPVVVIPSGVDHKTFYPSYTAKLSSAESSALNAISSKEESSKITVGIFLRSIATSLDKGQFVLREIIHRLSSSDKYRLIIFSPEPYIKELSTYSNVTINKTPMTRDKIAKALREVDIFIDSSLHEGFGLLPLEAMACGATIIVSDSGGINQYLKNNENGIIIIEVNNPDCYLNALEILSDDREKLKQLKVKALKTSEQFDFNKLASRFFKEIGYEKSEEDKNNTFSEALHSPQLSH